MKSVRAYLIALVVTCMMLATIGFGVLLWEARENARRDVAGQARETAQALSQAVDAELQRAEGILRALAASDAVRNRRWGAVERQARAAFADPNAWIIVQDRQGRQLVNTRLPAGARLPQAPPPAAMWRALDAGRSHVCNLVNGSVERRIVCVDVGEASSGKPAYALSVVFRPQFFQSIVRRQNVEAGQLASLVDRDGIVVWRNIRPQVHIGKTASGPMLERLRSPAPSGSLESVSLDGVRMLSAYQRSASSGWSVIVGLPLDATGATPVGTLLRGSVLALVVMVVGLLLAGIFGRKLVRGLERLGHSLDPNAAVGPRGQIGLAEFDAAAEALKRASDARTRSERNQQMLIGELNHRVKNTLAVVQSLAHQTFRGSADPKAAIGAFESRLEALGRAHNLLTRERWQSAPLGEVVRAALAAFCGPGRCEIGGPDVTVPPRTAVSLSLALHELATNAVKYGAFSVPGGKVSVRWQVRDGRFEITWTEQDGPAVTAPVRQGFGTRLIQRTLAAELNGEVAMDFAPSGLRCRVVGSLAEREGADVLAAIA